jgi:hypothetical protein
VRARFASAGSDRKPGVHTSLAMMIGSTVCPLHVEEAADHVDPVDWGAVAMAVIAAVEKYLHWY